MIAQLRGEVVGKLDQSLIIDVNGVGYELLLTGRDISKVPLNQTVTVYTYFHVRENSQELYGFADASARRIFEKLIGVSGVGPRMALSVMDLGEVNQIETALVQGDAKFISSASGVGKKIAERICVDLQEKAGTFESIATKSQKGSDDAYDALIALGYSGPQAAKALQSVDNKLKTEDRIKHALRLMAQ